MKNENVIWTPQEKQMEFMETTEDEALYGGAAGGGKSDALLVEALRQVHIRNYRGLVLRRTFPQLEALIARSVELYKAAFPGAKYIENKKMWRFPSGGKIFFGHVQYEKDKYNYQGKPYDFIAFDELTQFTYTQYDYIKSRNRPTGPGTEVYVRATANPGGVGHGWVKERFISPAPPGTRINQRVKVKSPDGKMKEMVQSRIFIPSTVFDNQRLLENDPGYLATLASLPEKERKALLYGDWDSFSGQVFTEWKNDPKHYDDQRFTHVIKPFRIPKWWKIYRGFDFGYAKPFSVGWYAIDEKGKVYRIRELYGCTGTPNEGVMWNPVRIAKKITEIENEDMNLKGRKIHGIADPSIFDESRGESVARMMAKPPNFVYWTGGDNNRIPGKMQFHYRLAFDEEGDTMFQVFDSCKHFIRTIPALVYDETNVEDIDTDTEDHIYDECRYVLMEHLISPRKNEQQDREFADDPLDLLPRGRKKYRV